MLPTKSVSLYKFLSSILALTLQPFSSFTSSQILPNALRSQTFSLLSWLSLSTFSHRTYLQDRSVDNSLEYYWNMFIYWCRVDFLAKFWYFIFSSERLLCALNIQTLIKYRPSPNSLKTRSPTIPQILVFTWIELFRIHSDTRFRSI